MTDFRFSGGRKTNGPLIHAFITPISDQHKTIIYHARNSLLFNNEKPWVERNNQSMFDVTMGSYDGAEICELVGLFILNELSKALGKDRVGLYRDDQLILLRGTSGRIADQTRKILHRIFDEQFGLKITAEVCHSQFIRRKLPPLQKTK